MTKKTRAKVRRALLSLSMVLVMMLVAVGGTIAWLTDKSDTVTNTFTPTKIDVSLTETADPNEFRILPGKVIAKDPKVTLAAGSEACYLFVKIEESTNYQTYFGNASYSVKAPWQKLTGVEGVNNVYYTEVSATDAKNGVNYDVLNGNTVTVPTTLGQDVLSGLYADGATNPTLTFTAYAVQKEAGTAAQAWVLAEASGKYYTQNTNN